MLKYQQKNKKNPDTKRYRDNEIIEVIISLRTVVALRKQSGGLFLAATARGFAPEDTSVGYKKATKV